MASCYPLATDHEQTSNTTLIVHTTVNDSEQVADEIDSNQIRHLPNTDDAILVDDHYAYFKEKFSRLKLQFPSGFENANVLWNIDIASPLHIVISDLARSCDNSSSTEHENKLKSFYDIVGRFNIGSVVKLDDIFHTKDYQRSFIRLTHSIKIMEAMKSVSAGMRNSVEIETFLASDLMSIISMINNIFHLNISHVLIGEHEVSLYKYISSLLSKEYGKKLNILEVPALPRFRESDIHSSSIETNELLFDATKDQIHEQFSRLEPTQKNVIHHYLKAMMETFLSEERLFQDALSVDMEITDIIDTIHRKILSSSSINPDPPIYVAASFLTDQFHVLRKHWKKNVNKDDKCTGTGKGIDGLPGNQKGFEPELGGKFIIIDWCNKEIVYTLDIDAPAGFFIEENYLYVANNRLNYISIIDLTHRMEMQRLKNSAFNCLHSLHRMENENLLITSTGIDAIIQTNSNGETLNDWYATEHGYTVTPKGEERNVARDFDHDQYIYPTLHQTTHINSAIVLDSDYYLATLFHQGSLVKIHRVSGKSEVLLSGLNCPHAIKRCRFPKENAIAWMLCNTKQNELLFLDDHFQIIQKMILEDVSWLQDATQLRNGNVIFTDANHSRIIEIDPDLSTVVSEFDYSTEWRIYQISDLHDFQTNFVPTAHK